MLQLTLNCKTLSGAQADGMVEVCELKATVSESGLVWLDIVNLKLEAFGASEEERTEVDEILRFAIMAGPRPQGTFYLRRNEEDDMEFEWEVPDSLILTHPSNPETQGAGPSPMTDFSKFHKIDYHAGYLSIDNSDEKLVVERYRLHQL